VAKYRLFAVRNRFANLCPASFAASMFYTKGEFFHNSEEVYVKEHE